MRRAPRHYHAINAFVQWLNLQKGGIEANMRELEPSVRPLTILPYYSLNVDTDMYPILMVEQTAVERDWESLDTGSGPMYKTRFTSTIWGMVAGYRDDVMDDLSVELEASVAEILNHRHESFDYGGWTFYFNETMPMPSSTYGITRLGQNMARGFTSTIVIDTLLSAAQAPGT